MPKNKKQHKNLTINYINTKPFLGQQKNMFAIEHLLCASGRYIVKMP